MTSLFTFLCSIIDHVSDVIVSFGANFLPEVPQFHMFVVRTRRVFDKLCLFFFSFVIIQALNRSWINSTCICL